MIFEKPPVLPDDLAKLSNEELNKLCTELRQRLIEVVSKNGGHLASNLGVVELTVALYSIYNPSRDRIVWDVGHQTYCHKILTGRDDKFDDLRRPGGVAGFPKRSESEADAFNVGHSSTSISAALGFARAYKLIGDDRAVVAVIGDGALTGGMAFEALNDAAQSKCNVKIILNDNGMSIDKNVGGLSRYLGKIRRRHSYMRTKKRLRNFLLKIPRVGRKITVFFSKQKNKLKHIVFEGRFFENLGFHYIGPVDGHDIYALKLAIEHANEIPGPVFVHVQTKKGCGYEPAEKQPEYFHGVANFNAETGSIMKNDSISLSKIFASKLIELAREDNKICAITAAMSKGTGLDLFYDAFPERFFDVGIAEQHAVTMAAGMAAAGMKPVVSIYSTFMQRAFDQLLHDVILQNLPLVVTLDRAGLCGYDGETHHGIYDFVYIGGLPRTALLAPSCKKTLEKGLQMSISVYDGAYEDIDLFAIRYPARERFEFENHPLYIDSDFSFGMGRIVFDSRSESDFVMIVSIGETLNEAFKAALELKERGVAAVLYDAIFLDIKDPRILELSKEAKHVITIEDAVKKNGFGERVKLFTERDVDIIAVTDDFVECDNLSNQLLRESISKDKITEYATR